MNKFWLATVAVVLLAGCDKAPTTQEEINVIEAQMRGVHFDAERRALDNAELLANTPPEARAALSKILNEAEAEDRRTDAIILKSLAADRDRLMPPPAPLMVEEPAAPAVAPVAPPSLDESNAAHTQARRMRFVGMSNELGIKVEEPAAPAVDEPPDCQTASAGRQCGFASDFGITLEKDRP